MSTTQRSEQRWTQLSSEALEVCISGAVLDKAILIIHSIAAGQVFGKEQCINLTLHDSVTSTSHMKETAAELREACYSHLAGVQAEGSLRRCVGRSDVVLVMLEGKSLEEAVAVSSKYAAVLNQSPRTKQRAIMLVGPRAATIGALLCVLSPQLSQQLVTFVESPQLESQYGCSYKLANRVRDHVNSWWTNLKERDSLTNRIGFSNVSGLLASDILPLPLTSVLVSRSTHRNLALSPELVDTVQVLQHFKAAMKSLELSEAAMASPHLFCQL